MPLALKVTMRMREEPGVGNRDSGVGKATSLRKSQVRQYHCRRKLALAVLNEPFDSLLATLTTRGSPLPPSRRVLHNTIPESPSIPVHADPNANSSNSPSRTTRCASASSRSNPVASVRISSMRACSIPAPHCVRSGAATPRQQTVRGIRVRHAVRSGLQRHRAGRAHCSGLVRAARNAMCRSPTTARKPRTTAKAATLVGAKLAGSVLIVDDVITAGTAIRESLALITRKAPSPPAY